VTAPAFLASDATVTPASTAPSMTTPPILPQDDRWHQRWRNHHHTWQHRDGRPFDPDRFTVVELDTRDGKHAARHLILDHHYAASWPAAMHCFGLIDRAPQLDDYPDPHPSAVTRAGRLVGAAVLSVPQHVAVVAKPFPRLTPYREAADLGRFLLLDPVAANAESWFLARVFRLARQRGVRGVVAFADPVPRRRGDGALVLPGHVGWSYQGHNAVYLGRSTPRPQILLPDGTNLPGRAVSKLAGSEPGARGVAARLRELGAPTVDAGETPAAWLDRALPAIGATIIRHPGKHKYAWRLDRGPTSQLGQPAMPYPKSIDPITATGGQR
jgi:hypothetical protein